MADTARTLRAIFHPTAIKVLASIVSVVGAYDIFSNQFSLPKLGRVAGMSGSLLPWWGWLLALQGVLVVGLFEYVRRNVTPSSFAEKNTQADAFSLPAGVPPISTPELRVDLERQIREMQEMAAKKIEKVDEGLRRALLEVANLLTPINEQIDLLSERTAEIERRTDFPSNMGETLGEALRTAEDVRLSQIAHIKDDTKAYSEKLTGAHGDLLHLLDWATNRASVRVLKQVLAARPRFNKLEPPLDGDARMGKMDDIRAWTNGIFTVCQKCKYGPEIIRNISEAKYQGEIEIRQLPAEKRPPGIDVLPFSDFYVAAVQCEKVSEHIEWVIRKLDGMESVVLATLVGRMDARQARS